MEGDPKEPDQNSSGSVGSSGVNAGSASRTPEASDPRHDVTGALHDVSNALTVMLGWIGEARAEGATRETIDDALRIVEQRGRAARDLARRAIGATPPSMDEEQAASVIVGEVIRALAVEAQRAGLRIVSRGGEGEGASALRRVLLGAAADVSQVVTNLVLNAIAHGPRGSEVTVVVTPRELQVALDVIDAGPGVSDERRDSIFEGDTTRAGGAGVGLRHARALARAAGGDVELLSPTEGAGAHFRVTWPRVDLIPPAPRSLPRLKIFEGKRVLVVEDDALVTQLLEAALTARGAEVTIARSLAELTAALSPGTPHDAVLIDLSPIAGDPGAAIASLRANSPDATLVVISGSAEELPVPLQADHVRFVRKPFEVGEIVSALAAENRRS